MSDLDLRETEVIERLTKKLQKMGLLYKILKQENETLKAELNFYKKEANSYAERLIQNKLLKDKQKKAIIKVEKLLKRINSL
jgi:hypothetical protein